MHWKYLLFDLDGTLTDPMQGITRSVQYALRHFGIEVEDLTTLCPFIGPPLRDSFREFYGMTSAQADEASEKYGEYFSRQGIFENKLYAGIPELLSALQAQGRHLQTRLSGRTDRPAFRVPRPFHAHLRRNGLRSLLDQSGRNPRDPRTTAHRRSVAGRHDRRPPLRHRGSRGRRRRVDRRIVGVRQPRRAGKGQSRLPRSRHPGTAASACIAHRPRIPCAAYAAANTSNRGNSPSRKHRNRPHRGRHVRRRPRPPAAITTPKDARGNRRRLHLSENPESPAEPGPIRFRTIFQISFRPAASPPRHICR